MHGDEMSSRLDRSESVAESTQKQSITRRHHQMCAPASSSARRKQPTMLPPVRYLARTPRTWPDLTTLHRHRASRRCRHRRWYQRQHHSQCQQQQQQQAMILLPGESPDNMTRKRPFCVHFLTLKRIILPRQARDKQPPPSESPDNMTEAPAQPRCQAPAGGTATGSAAALSRAPPPRHLRRKRIDLCC